MQIQITATALKDIKKLDSVTAKRLRKKLIAIQHSPDPLATAKKLTSPFDGQFRYRIGDFRVVCELAQQTLYILRVQHRREVYRS